MKNFDELIYKVLDLLEKGKSSQEIVSLFPEDKEELEEILKTINILNFQKEDALPSRELLKKIVTQIPSLRYSNKEVEKGRSFNLINLISENMTLNWKFISVFAVLAIFVSVVAYFQLVPQKTPYPQGSETQDQAFVAPTATGDIDDVIDAIFAYSNYEKATLNQEENDVSWLTSESQAVTDLANSYDETTF